MELKSVQLKPHREEEKSRGRDPRARSRAEGPRLSGWLFAPGRVLVSGDRMMLKKAGWGRGAVRPAGANGTKQLRPWPCHTFEFKESDPSGDRNYRVQK